MTKVLGLFLFTVALLFTPSLGKAMDLVGPIAPSQESAEASLHFFYSPTCPHCHAEHAFLDQLEPKYPNLSVYRYSVADRKTSDVLLEFAKRYNAERYLGVVPLTFVGDKFFVGFDETTVGADIEIAVQELTAITSLQTEDFTNKDTVVKTDTKPPLSVPFVGEVDPSRYPLPLLAILLGFLDGFNVCSLGALVLIIGLTLKLQRRRNILILGGTFLLITALVYGLLIVLWYQLFDVLSAVTGWVQWLVGLLALGGGLYFLREFWRMQKEGAVCSLTESKWVTRVTSRTNSLFSSTTNILALLGGVALFAGVIAVVEFPCSAAVPVVFAGVLADAGLGTASYLGNIALFVLFYLLDEIIIFGIAAYKMKIWLTNGTFTKWAVLTEALILIILGLLYVGLLG